MKLATFETGAAPQLGAVVGDRITPLSTAAPGLPGDMIGLIAAWPEVEGEVRRLAEAGAGALALDAVHLLAPIPRPGKIMAIGLNYADHIAESNLGTPEHQVWFSKATTAANGPYDAIQVPRVSQALDYEAELVAVIGQGGRHIGKDAAAAIFGYCCGNDATERAWQHRTPQWVVGKSFDTHAPFGPWITTADEIPDPHALGIRCLVNGEVRQDSNTKHLVFNIWDQVEHLSQAMTLEPGDLIFTGTPGGIGAAMKPMRFLKDGDRVRIEIAGLGALDNPCANEV
ncbi:MAG: fumarylacetoacetate hydrolase family protein [Alphaproteobacteria bacterium]|nr:fumarylacetoacetate hydrolase family protein [Alphaproteobacteria bacterium]MBU1516617.1 fumarylacetoacetate hydrolase family protein [Alphaproteobacteria bacterium]MBU2094373.1 fumarylacetoacetate hydrolase family protein [Alphaproteobacteria bacterium]MBU2153258.1 fumarylacetoacetate hydrolase family protein [Alphaproteobacteria bacterium]MBU2307544.1 fumarylacetoacetate hydrolase family protein [Alphaproteobacteria bacterium]